MQCKRTISFIMGSKSSTMSDIDVDRDGDGNKQEHFLNYELKGELILRDLIHVRIHLSVKTIKPMAFYRHRRFVIGILNNELEEIGMYAFSKCKLVECIIFPNLVAHVGNMSLICRRQPTISAKFCRQGDVATLKFFFSFPRKKMSGNDDIS